MHDRHRNLIKVIFLAFAMWGKPLYAANFACMQDLNGDSLFTSAGETASCTTTPDGQFCPISAVNCNATTTYTCPLDATTPCNNGSCSVPATCTNPVTWLPMYYVCSLDGNAYWGASLCASNCVQTAACTSSVTNTCPLGNGFACMNNSGTYQCSPNTCQDTSAAGAIATSQPAPSTVLTNDGARDPATGACLDQTVIFSGRNMECHPAGMVTAYKNCCADNGTVMYDSMGTLSEYQLATQAVVAVYDAAAAAYAAYSAYQAAGMAADAAAGGATAATNSLMYAFDPTTLAIAIAVALIMNYLANACDQMDMETAMLNGSKRCIPTGDYCTKRMFGGCVQRAQTFCCFNSQLARIVHEQGRPQLKSFATTPITDCRGFTPEEFQSLDFSRIDLSEYYGTLKQQSLTVIQDNGTNKIKAFVGSTP